MSQRKAQTSFAARIIVLALVFCASATLLVAQKQLKLNTYYMCGNTRMFVNYCVNTANESVNDCTVMLPDRPKAQNGNMAATFMLHSDLVNRIQTCQELGPVASAATGPGTARPGSTAGPGPNFPPFKAQSTLQTAWASTVNALSTAVVVLIAVIAIGAVLGLGGWWIYKKIFYSRYLVVRRSNQQALEEFGPDQATRERTITQAFDTMNHTFKLVGENRDKQYMLRFELWRDIRMFKRDDLECLRFAYFAFNRGLLDDERFYTYRITAIYQGGQIDPTRKEYLGLLGFWRERKKQGEIARVRAAVRGFAAANCTPNLKNQTMAMIQDLVRRFPNDHFFSDMERRLREGSRWLAVGDIPNSIYKDATRWNEIPLQLGVLDGTNVRLKFPRDTSILTIAPAGSGKTRCVAVPNLLRWPGAAVVLDVKGELYDLTSKYRSTIGPVIRFSPLEPDNSHCYNPLAFIRRETQHVWDDSVKAAAMIVPRGSGGEKNQFFENSARDIITAIFADMAFWHKPEDRPVARVHSILNRNGWDEFLDRLRKNPEIDELRDLGVGWANEHAETLSNILSFARTSMSCWKGPSIAKVTSRSDWHPLDLRGGKRPTIYICINSEDIEVYASFLRVFIAQHINALMTVKIPADGLEPILFCLDEFPQLGGMESLEKALAVGRGFGLRMWLFAQDMDQIEKSYKTSKTIVGNCAVRTFMKPTPITAALLAEEIGEAGLAQGVDEQSSVSAQELAGPGYENLIIALGASAKPAKLQRVDYSRDPEISGRVGTLDVLPKIDFKGGPVQTGAAAGA
jgi:type IV secretory pathway TraG/TraD family ATPase VirD4